VYQQIMEKVVQTSQNDFEESGVDHSTLDEMKQVCCNLAALRLSRLPLRCRSSAQSLHRHVAFSPSRLICKTFPRIVFARCGDRTMAAWLGVMGG
jgi:hypothetical protein